MATIEPDYWAAAATVAPVLAAAVVFEAKSTLARLEGSTTAYVLMSVVHALVLIGLGFSVSFCFQALRGVEPEPYWTITIENAVSSAVGMLVIGPAAALLLTSASISVKSGRIQWYKARIRMLQFSSRRAYKPLVEMLSELADQRDELRRAIATASDESNPSKQELIEALSKVDQVYDKGRRMFEAFPAIPKRPNERKLDTDDEAIE